MTPPIYRARCKDNGELVEGYLFLAKDEWTIQCNITDDTCSFVDIDPSTLAISFEDMTDKNGKRIFAALNESGVGGDYELQENDDYKWIWIYSNGCFKCTDFNGEWYDFEYVKLNGYIEVTGIYEGDQQ